MTLAVIASIITILVGFWADVFLAPLNWPNAGAVCAVAAMGAFLLWSNLQKNKPD